MNTDLFYLTTEEKLSLAENACLYGEYKLVELLVVLLLDEIDLEHEDENDRSNHATRLIDLIEQVEDLDLPYF